MARIKLKAYQPLDVLTELGVPAGTIVELVAINPAKILRVYNTAASPVIDDDDCVPIVFGTQSVVTEASDPGIWLYSENYVEVYAKVSE